MFEGLEQYFHIDSVMNTVNILKNFVHQSFWQNMHMQTYSADPDQMKEQSDPDLHYWLLHY